MPQLEADTRKLSKAGFVLGLLLVIAACAAALGAAGASAASKPSMTVSVSPGSVVAGSSGNAVTFQFTANESSQTQLSIIVPAPTAGAAWSAPQSSDPSGAGYVVASKQTCNSASVSSITGTRPGPWVMNVSEKCSKGKSFLLTYGGGTGTKVTAATKAGPYTFLTREKVGKTTLALPQQPLVTVRPGPTASIDTDDFFNFTIPGGGWVGSQDVTVVAYDAYGNIADENSRDLGFDLAIDPPCEALICGIEPEGVQFTHGIAHAQIGYDAPAGGSVTVFGDLQGRSIGFQKTFTMEAITPNFSALSIVNPPEDPTTDDYTLSFPALSLDDVSPVAEVSNVYLVPDTGVLTATVTLTYDNGNQTEQFSGSFTSPVDSQTGQQLDPSEAANLDGTTIKVSECIGTIVGVLSESASDCAGNRPLYQVNIVPGQYYTPITSDTPNVPGRIYATLADLSRTGCRLDYYYDFKTGLCQPIS